MPNPAESARIVGSLGLPSDLLPRHLRPLVLEALADTRVVLVLGARQVGKSTLTRDVALRDYPAQILTLDDKTTRDAASSDPTGFVAALSQPALIDEVQRAPDLLLAIKESVDLDQRPGRFLLTGSANILTAPKIYEALTGRVEILNLWPLSQSEIERTSENIVDRLFGGTSPLIVGAPVGREAWVTRATAGGYPEARLRPSRRRSRWFRSYLTTLVERDLRDIADAHKLHQIPRLLRLIAGQAAGLFAPTNIAGRMGLDKKTVQSYTDLLETVFVVRRVQAWRPGIGSREVQHEKIYVVDSGLLVHLLGSNESRLSGDGQTAGKVFENFVAMEIARHVDWAETVARQYHYRQRDDEVDIVLETQSGELVAVECKAAATVRHSDYRPIEKLRDARDDAFVAGYVVYCGASTVPLADRIWALPVGALWQ